MRRVLSALSLAAAFSASAISAAPQASIQASRTSGVAPLAVHFDATNSSDGTYDSFHDLYYTWDFGDANATGNWAASGLPKGRDGGPITAHVFEAPGTYSVRLTVRGPGGGTATATATINVADPATVFTGTKTTCVSASGNFTGCPTGAAQVTSASLNTAMQSAGTGKRVLLRRGDSFTGSSVVVNQAGPATVGAFGTGAAPSITSSGTVFKLSGNPDNFDDWRFMDLTIHGPGTNGSQVFNSSGSVQRLLALRITADRFHTNVLMNPNTVSALGQPMHSEVFVVESTFTNMQGGGGGNGVYWASNKLVLLGTRIENAESVEHVTRFPYLSKAVIAHNLLAYPAPMKAVIKLCALQHTDSHPFPERDSTWIVVANNVFRSRANQGNVGIQPQDQLHDERILEVLVEGNYFVAGPISVNELNVSAVNVTVRDNVFNLNASANHGANVLRRGVEPSPANVRIYNNTCWGPSGALDCVDFNGGTGHWSYNNLAVGGAGSEVSTGTATAGGNLILSAAPFVAASPMNFTDFRLASATAAVDKGVAVPVASLDPLDVVRAADGDGDGILEWDVGAFEFGTSSGGGGTTPPPPPPPANAPAAPVLLP